MRILICNAIGEVYICLIERDQALLDSYRAQGFSVIVRKFNCI